VERRSNLARTIVAAAALVLSLTTAGCGGGGSSPGGEMVWCVAPGEVVDAQFKREYPELYMSKAACDAAGGR
jgi:hypothetical protein